MLTVKTMTCIASNDGILQAFGVKMNRSLDAEDLITRNQTQKIKFSEKKCIAVIESSSEGRPTCQQFD